MLLLFAVTVTAAIANVVIDDNDPVVVAIDNIVVAASVDFLDVVIVAVIFTAAIANVVIDDMIDTAGTVTKAVDALIEEGAKDVIIAATHAVLSGPAVDRLKKSRVSEVVVTNTLPISEENRFSNLTVLSIAPLLARAIKEVFEDGSVTSLFDGHS